MEARNNTGKSWREEEGKRRSNWEDLPVRQIGDLVGHEIEALWYKEKDGPYGKWIWALVRDHTEHEKCWLRTGASVVCRKLKSAVEYGKKGIVGKVVNRGRYFDIEWL